MKLKTRFIGLVLPAGRVRDANLNKLTDRSYRAKRSQCIQAIGCVSLVKV